MFRVYLLILALVILVSSAHPAPSPLNHPDGFVGRINGFVGIRYSTAYTVPENLINDKLTPEGGIAIPLGKQLTLAGALSVSTGDTLFYNYSLGLKFYLGNPLRTDNRLNPDGAIGVPIIGLSGGGFVPDIEFNRNLFFADINILLPLSQKLSFGIGGKIYEDENIYQVDNFYGILNIFPRAYSIDRPYANPDGVPGTPSLSLIGGGSQYGIVGILDIKVPLTDMTTLIFLIKGERAADPYLRQATLGARIQFYAGN
ncbi:MAG: hypothetical protein ABIJ45_02900 [Candidatus Zixiibacteriota bacterium]